MPLTVGNRFLHNTVVNVCVTTGAGEYHPFRLCSALCHRQQHACGLGWWQRKYVLAVYHNNERRFFTV